MDANGSGALAPRRALAAAIGKEKLEVLLSAPDPEALVQSIPDQELYLALLKERYEREKELVGFHLFILLSGLNLSSSGSA